MFDIIWQDVRHAFRGLLRAPAFAVIATLTLGLGIGATISIFTVAAATLLTPPPYPQPDRMLVLTVPDGGAGSTAREFAFVRDRSRMLAAICSQRSTPGWNLVVGSRAQFVEGLEVTDGYFETHGIRLLLGRGISRAEAQVGGARSVVISEGLWRRLFDARVDVVGQVVELGGRPHQVIGVAPAGFRSIPRVDVWTPLQIASESNAANQLLVGRIATGRTRSDALAELDSMRPAFREALGERARRVEFLTWMPYQDWLSTGTRGTLTTLLLGAVGFLLLLACINVAGLQVARGISRVREFTTRAALGATGFRVARGVLIESLLLAVMGALLGLSFAFAGTRALLSLLSEDVLEDLLAGQSVYIDARALGVTVLIAVGAAILSGLVPAMSAAATERKSRPGHPEHHTPGRRSVWLRRALVVGQCAIAVVLLTAAGLLIRTFVTLRGTNAGFEAANVVVGETAIQGDRIDPFERNNLIRRTLDSVQSIPGVTAAAVSSRVPVDVAVNLPVRATGQALVADTRAVDWTYVTDGYFSLFEIPLRAGRVFDLRDGIGSAPVAIVNEAFARAFYGRLDVVGETIQTLGVGEPLRQIVGVVGDTRSRSNAGWTRGLSALGAASPPILYVPEAQTSADAFRLIHSYTPIRWIVKSAVAPAAMQESMREAVRRHVPKLPFIRFFTMQQIIGRDLEFQRFLMTLVAVFSAIALLLAVIGLYALVSHLATQRTREVGIRMAVGATPAGVLATFLGEGFAIGGIGLCIGLGGAALITRTMTVFLVGVTPKDAATFTSAGFLLLIVSGLSALWPAVRASRVNPVQALRTE